MRLNYQLGKEKVPENAGMSILNSRRKVKILRRNEVLLLKKESNNNCTTEILYSVTLPCQGEIGVQVSYMLV